MSSTDHEKQAQAKKSDDADREMVTLSGKQFFPGIPYRSNHDGTFTYFPKTTVNYFTPNDYGTLQEKLKPEEMALLEENVVEGISDDKFRSRSQDPSKVDPEWKKACDVHYSIKGASDKEYVFIATRHFEKSEVVGVAHLSIGQKGTDVAESLPAKIYVDRHITLDVCRGKSKLALRELLSAVHDFFEAWASFQIQMDKLENGGRGSMSCYYTLRLPVASDEGWMGSKIGKIIQQGKPAEEDGAAWIRPTAHMCTNWGYETKEKQPRFTSDGETVVVVCEKRR